MSGKLLLIVCLLCGVSAKNILYIDKVRDDFDNVVQKLWNLPDLNEAYLVRSFYEFDVRMKQVSSENIYEMLRPVIKIPLYIHLYAELKIMENKYESFIEFQRGFLMRNKNSADIEGVVADVLSNNTGVSAVSKNIYNMVTTIFNTDNYGMELEYFSCEGHQQSQYQLHYNLYTVLSMVFLKSYVLEQFVYLFTRLWQQENIEDLVEVSKGNYITRVNFVQNKSRRVTSYYPAHNIYRCDPKRYVEGTNYEKFTYFLQGQIQNEADLAPSKTCQNSCEYYAYTSRYTCYSYTSGFCRREKRCSGAIHECFYIQKSADVCISSSRERKYDFVKYNSGQVLGKSKSCKTEHISSWLRGFVHCDYCMCICDEISSLSHRYISLQLVRSDVQNNRVITGVRFVKKNRIIHFQIQEGKLLPYGHIDQDTVRWVPVDQFEITDYGIYENYNFTKLTFSHRKLTLEELDMVGLNSVLTGIRFEVSANDMIRIVARANSFNWTSGKLSKEYEEISNIERPYLMSDVDISNADIPTITPQPSTRHYRNNYYVKIHHTSFRKDVAQTAIPFIDTQDVITNPAVPLSGIGVYYKGINGYGGFIGPSINTYHYLYNF